MLGLYGENAKMIGEAVMSPSQYNFLGLPLSPEIIWTSLNVRPRS